MNKLISSAAVALTLCFLVKPAEVAAQLIRQPNTTLNLSPTSPPPTLSGTGAFSNLATLTPHTGIVPYEPNVPFWSDYAEKRRWFSITNLNDRMIFDADGNWTLPTGMVWVKHFDLPLNRSDPAAGPRRRLETRFLVKTTIGTYGLTYKWRDDQTEADLVGEDGEDAFYQVQVNGQTVHQRWHYPARYECRQCHTAIGGHALSFNTRQMNRSHPHGSLNPNQIQALSDAGYFTTPVRGVNNLPALAKANDTSQSLEWRVRSYFAANCMQCHQPGGPSFAIWDARPTTRTDAAHIINGMLNYVGDDEANRFVVPGDLSHSMAYKRLLGEEPRMPPLATTELDPGAIQLLQEWIMQALPGRLSFAQWQVQFFGSSANPSAGENADPDRDGHTNFAEFHAYTDPTNATSAPARPQGALVAGGSQVQFTFTHPANRAVLIETSTDMRNWSLWDVPGNSPSYPPVTLSRSLVAPLESDTRRFFRLRLSTP
jgi:mono/diheme cytochrome c family protein